MMRESMELAGEQAVEEIFSLILSRVAWMDEKGIRQWNVTGYAEAYPREYYREQARQGRLYVLRREGRAAAAAVLLEEDPRWEGAAPAVPAYYVHNLAGALEAPGAGSELLEDIEALARSRGRTRVRLDCAVDNGPLNRWYEARGYYPVGGCTDGPYVGTLREKVLE